ncbi:hypothetical protein CSC94_20040 [Zhengella mangrovi]|uniref:Bacterial transcriptional activator domain-containing protein n=1 Tax=Zhengella mangrovi TaxID=1982044 RepID=A0A2G1QI37_9HYPH|nr:BTAD domain-containing putative transcriptional regulator [Zhengella mangrovi]PHP65207.1 hypothetical protein CSC94_20040 [Zhengella mangrovi]
MAVALFGGMHVTATSQDGSGLLTRKTRLVLAAICVGDEAGVSRATLAGWIWPDRAEAQARTSLRQALTALRKALPVILPGFDLHTDQDVVRLSGSPHGIDVRAFGQLARSEAPQDRAKAAGLYAGELLDGVDMPDTMETMVLQLRRQLHQQALDLVESLSLTGDLAEGDTQACGDLATRLLAVDPAAEEAHRALIRIRLASGQVNAARKQYGTCAGEVMRAYGTEPEVQTRQLIEAMAGTGEPVAGNGKEGRQPDFDHHDLFSRPAVLFLPFETLSSTPDDALLALGLCEDIRTNLSSWRSFPVIGQEALGGRTGDILDLAAGVKAAYAVNGSVRRSGNQARVVARLIDAVNGQELWSQTFDGELQDVFAFQDEISRRIVSQIEPELSQATARKIAVSRPGDLTAWELLTKAVDAERRGGDGYGTPEANRLQWEFVTEAIRRDPDLSEAWARLARCNFRDFLMGWVEDRNAALRQGLEASARAVQIDPGNSLAQAFRAQCILFGTKDPQAAFDHAAEAVRLNPSNVMGNFMMGCTLVYCGEPETAFDHYETVLRLNPAFPARGALYCDQMMCKALAGNVEDATVFARRSIDIAPSYLRGLQRCASVFAHAGLMEDAREALDRVEALGGPFDETYLRDTYPFVRTQDFEFLVSGLRKAGWTPRQTS